ncbi:MAG: hypothetical protein ACOX8H_14335 [Ruminococcus sp.]
MKKSKKNKNPSTDHSENSREVQALNHEHEKLIRWFQEVKFKKALFGGVDERRLWKKLEELNQLYEVALSAERARYDALLNDYIKTANGLIRRYKRELDSGRKEREDGS